MVGAKLRSERTSSHASFSHCCLPACLPARLCFFIVSVSLQFDPLGISQWAPAEWLRKGELSNGRAAMLATVGWAWPSLVGHFDSPDVTTTDPIDAILQADNQWWAQWLLLCGTIEAMKYRAELEGKSYTGDGPAAFDWAKQWDKLDAAGKESMRLKELKNGRLAMLGIAGFVANHLIPGACPVPPGF